LGAVGRGVARVFDVAAGEDAAVFGLQRRAHRKAGVRHIGEAARFKRGADQRGGLRARQRGAHSCAPSATFIIAVKLVWRCSAVVASGETKLSEMVSRQAACLPRTLALWNSAKLSISTARQPFSSRRRSQYVGFASLGWR